MLDPSSDLPKFLYRYRSPATEYFWSELEAAVQRRQIFLPAAHFLNDPFDCSPAVMQSSLKQIRGAQKQIYAYRPAFDRGRFEEMHGRAISRSNWRRIRRKVSAPIGLAALDRRIASKMINEARRRTKIACFSEVKDSALMWSHYATHHSGICIEYELDHRAAQRFGDDLPLPVRYTDTRSLVSTVDLLRFAKDATFRTEDGERVMDALYLEKSSDWSYEREWRVFTMDSGEDRYHRFMSMKPATVILGSNWNEAATERLLSIVGDRISIISARPHPTQYELLIEERI